MSHNAVLVSCVAMLAFAGFACGGAQSDTPNTPNEEGAPKTLVDDGPTREQLKADLNTAIQNTDNEIKALGDRLDATTDGAREDIERDLKKLKERRADLADALSRLDAQANETFRDVRQEIQGLLRDVGVRGGDDE